LISQTSPFLRSGASERQSLGTRSGDFHTVEKVSKSSSQSPDFGSFGIRLRIQSHTTQKVSNVFLRYSMTLQLRNLHCAIIGWFDVTRTRVHFSFPYVKFTRQRHQRLDLSSPQPCTSCICFSSPSLLRPQLPPGGDARSINSSPTASH
jgi:hypothetical protein